MNIPCFNYVSSEVTGNLVQQAKKRKFGFGNDEESEEMDYGDENKSNVKSTCSGADEMAKVQPAFKFVCEQYQKTCQWASELRKQFSNCKSFIMVSDEPMNAANRIVQCKSFENNAEIKIVDSMSDPHFETFAADSLGTVKNVGITNNIWYQKFKNCAI